MFKLLSAIVASTASALYVVASVGAFDHYAFGMIAHILAGG